MQKWLSRKLLVAIVAVVAVMAVVVGRVKVAAAPTLIVTLPTAEVPEDPVTDTTVGGIMYS